MHNLYIIVAVLVIFNIRSLYSVVSHQAYFYASSGYTKLSLDQTENIYDVWLESVGVGYRANLFVSKISRHFFSFGISGITTNITGSIRPITNYTTNYNTNVVYNIIDNPTILEKDEQNKFNINSLKDIINTNYNITLGTY